MITKFKIFENINVGEPKVGDYVICSDHVNQNKDYRSFLSNTVGYYYENKGWGFDWPYKILFSNIPENIKKKYFKDRDWATFAKKDIKYWSKDKEELELIITSLKFNI